MEQTLLLAATAASVGFVHTLLGPDHYVPFAAMARAGRWSMARTLVITSLCGIGHVAGSVALGLCGVALGVAVFKLEGVESHRGQIAAWLLLAFGIAYTAWGLRRAVRGRPHTHLHAHANGTVHRHPHTHEAEHLHAHASERSLAVDHDHAATDGPRDLKLWVLFTIFLFGPCEPLIPLVMYPAAKGSIWNVLLVTSVFAATTIGVMLVAVTALHLGLGAVRLQRLERFTHAFAGLTLISCGAAMCAGL